MLKRLAMCVTLLLSLSNAFAANLLEVYQQALTSDPTFQQAITDRLAQGENVPMSIAALLPQVVLTANPAITRSGFAGTNFAATPGTTASYFAPRNNTMHSYTLALTAQQTVFNFAQFSQVKLALANSKSAEAALNAALQDLLVRTANAYFAVLEDEDNLTYTFATKRAYKQALDQVQQQYKVGLKTVTDVYIARAAYDTSDANHIAASAKLDNDRENLRMITGRYYTQLDPLSDQFPLVSPNPQDVERWVKVATLQNWSIKSAQYKVEAARSNIKMQEAGHLPTIAVQGTLDRSYMYNNNGYNSLNSRQGPGTQTDRQIAVNINFPIFAGGAVSAATRQATYQYSSASQQLEAVLRKTINATRQSYIGIMAGISQIKADKQAIKSTESSYRGMQASYQVGTDTLVNVLNQQEKVLAARSQYAKDRYRLVNNILQLKQAAGTLSMHDLKIINAWLVDKKHKK